MRNYKTVKILYITIAATLILAGCKDQKPTKEESPEAEKTVLEKIAVAHGFDNWKKVNEIQFTFNVDRDTTHYERSWIWDTRSNQVTAIMGTDTISYQRQAVDSTVAKIDAGFINDKYWLLAPFNLVWDKGSFTYEHSEEQKAPISEKPMQKLTIVYGGEGGYTPGDAYDFYFGNDHIVREWVFRKGNQADPSTITTWDSYEEIQGLLISKLHEKDDGSVTLSFSDLKVN